MTAPIFYINIPSPVACRGPYVGGVSIRHPRPLGHTGQTRDDDGDVSITRKVCMNAMNLTISPPCFQDDILVMSLS